LFDGFLERLRIDDVLRTVLEPLRSSIEEVESPDVLDCGYGTGSWIREFLEMLEIDDSDGVSEPLSLFRRISLWMRVCSKTLSAVAIKSSLTHSRSLASTSSTGMSPVCNSSITCHGTSTLRFEMLQQDLCDPTNSI
jgi:hypothetical protein